jgi:hypothetical protein
MATPASSVGPLVAAGFAPVFAERPLGDPALDVARRAVDLVLKGHEPYPALAIDRHWTLIAANRAVAPLLAGIDPSLLQPPVNVLRLSLHPGGIAPRIVNASEWRTHIVERLRRQVAATADAALTALLDELRRYPLPDAGAARQEPPSDFGGVLVPLRLRTESGVLSFVSTTTIFGTPVDVTLSELAIESFFPADAATAAALHAVVQG